jgi:phosphatidylglycerophosphate synthase
LTAPNALSLARIALAVPTVWAIVTGRNVTAFALLLLALATDFLDGALARRGRVSDLGKVLDPLADKVFAAAVLGALVVAGRVPVGLAAVLVTRDLVLLALGWLRMRAGGGVPGADPAGKVAFGTLGVYLAGEVLGIDWPAWAPAFIGATYVLGALPYVRRVPGIAVGGVAKGER